MFTGSQSKTPEPGFVQNLQGSDNSKTEHTSSKSSSKRMFFMDTIFFLYYIVSVWPIINRRTKKLNTLTECCDEKVPSSGFDGKCQTQVQLSCNVTGDKYL